MFNAFTESGRLASHGGEWPVGACDRRMSRHLAIGSWLGCDRNAVPVLFKMYRCRIDCEFIFI